MDISADGYFNPSADIPLPNVTVNQLDAPDKEGKSTTTDEQGLFSFSVSQNPVIKTVIDKTKLPDKLHNMEGFSVSKLAVGQTPPSARELLQRLRNIENQPKKAGQGSTVQEDVLIKVLKGVARDLLDTHISRQPDLSLKSGKEAIDCYCWISMAIFFTRELINESARQKVCQKVAADNNAVDITWAYLDLKKDLQSEHQLEEQKFLTMDYLIANWEVRVDEKRNVLDRKFIKEKQTLHDTLQQGTWLTKMPYLLELTQTAQRNDLVSQILAAIAKTRKPAERDMQTECIDWLEKLRGVQEPVKEAFKKLELDTIERFLEARTVTPYLILFDSKKGSLGAMIDRLVSPAKQSWIKEIGIVNYTENNKPVYNFKHYTFNARIGLAPSGWTLEHFCNTFKEDFAKLEQAMGKTETRNTNIASKAVQGTTLEAAELVVLRYGLSGRYHYHFGAPDYKVPWTRRSIENIKELFEETLEPKDLVTLVQYEGKATGLDKILKALTHGKKS